MRPSPGTELEMREPWLKLATLALLSWITPTNLELIQKVTFRDPDLKERQVSRCGRLQSNLRNFNLSASPENCRTS
jgi:hypothetical protein